MLFNNIGIAVCVPFPPMNPCCLSSIKPHFIQNFFIFSIITPVHIFLITSNNISGRSSDSVGSMTLGIGASMESPHPLGTSFLIQDPVSSSYTLFFTLSSIFPTWNTIRLSFYQCKAVFSKTAFCPPPPQNFMRKSSLGYPENNFNVFDLGNVLFSSHNDGMMR